MKSPPARAGPQGHHLVAGDGSAPRMAQLQVSVNQLWQSRCRARMTGRSSPASGTKWWSSKAMWVRPGWMRGSVYWVLLVLGRDVKNTGPRPVSELQTTSPRSFFLKPMTDRFSVLKNVLSGRFNARDDFWVVQVAKKPSQLVSVPTMAISQEDRMGIFVLNRQSHVSHLSGVGLTDFAIPFLGLR